MDTSRFGELPTERLNERGEELEKLLEIPRNPEHPRTRELSREYRAALFELAWRLAQEKNDV